MKAMILAAGKGTRMQPLTYELPKPMIPIMGKPVMEFLIEELAQHRFTDIMINTSHHADKIERFFGNGQRWGIRIGYSFEGYSKEDQVVAMPLGSAGGLKRIQEFSGFFDDTFVVVCGDALIDIDLTKAIREHWKKGAAASLCVAEVPQHRVPHYGVVDCEPDGRIRSFQEKPTVKEAKSNWVNTGVYIFEPEVLDLIPPNTQYDIGSELFPKILEQKLPFYAIHLPFNWFDIGRIRDYWEVNQRLMQGQFKHTTIPGREIQPGVWTGLNVAAQWDKIRCQGPVFIDSGCLIEPGSQIIGPTWIGHGCHIHKNANVSRSILFDYTCVHAGISIQDSIVFGRYCVDKNGQNVDYSPAADWISDAREIGSLGLSPES